MTTKENKDRQRMRLASKATEQLAQQARQAAQQEAQARKDAKIGHIITGLDLWLFMRSKGTKDPQNCW